MRLKDLKNLNTYPPNILRNIGSSDKKSSNGFSINKYNSVFVEVLTNTDVNNKICEYIIAELNRCSDMKSVSHLFINCKPNSTVFPSSSKSDIDGNISKTMLLKYMIIYIDGEVRYVINRYDNKMVLYSTLSVAAKTIIGKLIKQLK